MIVKGLIKRGLVGTGLLTVALAWPGSSPRVWAAAATQGDTTGGTIVQVQPGSGDTTTPSACDGALSECTTQMLKLLNRDRIQAGLAKLTLKPEQSVGKDSCIGSYGHSHAMAKSGSIWHVNPEFPRASFPKSICVPFMHAGENVGESASGSATADLKTLDALMITEPHSKAVCATTVNHACNILNPEFHQVGIGVYYAHGATWLTEDFTD